MSTATYESPVFAGINRRERNLITRFGTVTTLLDGHEVTTQGEYGRQFGVVLSGELRVVRDGVEVARIREGEVFGEIALLAGPRARQTATVEAAGTVRIVVFSRAEFAELCDRVPAFAARVQLIGLRRLARSGA